METDALVLDHLELVERCARRFRGWGEAHDDLVQVGRLALIRASRRYDAARGVPFAAYASACVQGAIRHHLRDDSCVVRSPRGGQRTTVVELTEADTVDIGAYDRVELRELLLRQLERLPPRECEVLVLRFVDGLTQEAVAARVGTSQAQVSRLQARALARLRRRLDVA